mgnify:CR=1 FL=1
MSWQLESTGVEELVVKVHFHLLILSRYTLISSIYRSKIRALKMAVASLKAQWNGTNIPAVDLFSGSLCLEEFTKAEFVPHKLAPIYDARACPNWFIYKEQDEISKSLSCSIFYRKRYYIKVCQVQVPKTINVHEGTVSLESSEPYVVLLGNSNIVDGLQSEQVAYSLLFSRLFTHKVDQPFR